MCATRTIPSVQCLYRAVFCPGIRRAGSPRRRASMPRRRWGENGRLRAVLIPSPVAPHSRLRYVLPVRATLSASGPTGNQAQARARSISRSRWERTMRPDTASRLAIGVLGMLFACALLPGTSPTAVRRRTRRAPRTPISGRASTRSPSASSTVRDSAAGTRSTSTLRSPGKSSGERAWA